MEGNERTGAGRDPFPVVGVLGLGFSIGTITCMSFSREALMVVSALVVVWFMSWHLWFDPHKDSRPQYLMSSYTLAVMIQAGLWYPQDLLLALRFVLYAGSSVLVLIGLIYGIGMLGLAREKSKARAKSRPEFVVAVA